MEEIIDAIKSHPRYQKNIEYGQPRSGHPEGEIKNHIEDLERNLKALNKREKISLEDFLKLKFLIHVHDTFKAEVKKDSPILYERSHAALAREFANQYTNDEDLLNMLQFHDMNYHLWKEYLKTGVLDANKFQLLLDSIKDWNLFLIFIIIDGCVDGKDCDKIPWFINEVRKHKTTTVDSSWFFSLKKEKNFN